MQLGGNPHRINFLSVSTTTVATSGTSTAEEARVQNVVVISAIHSGSLSTQPREISFRSSNRSVATESFAHCHWRL
jgi:hypothetical protein